MRQIKSKLWSGRSRKPNKWETLEEETTSWLFGENPNRNSGLVPFGWILCEKIEDNISIDRDKQQKRVKERFEAIDMLHKLQDKKIEEQKALALAKEEKLKKKPKLELKRDGRESSISFYDSCSDDL